MQKSAEINTNKEVNYTSTNVDEDSESNKEFSYDTILSLGNKVRMTDKDENNGLDKKPINICGYPQKLKELGWEIKYDIDKIIDELK